MLKPSMSELMNKVGNRYLLVNLAAQRARDLSDESEETEMPLPEKAVQIALEDIASGDIVYRPGEKDVLKQTATHVPGTLGMLDIDYSDEDDEVVLDDEEEENKQNDAGEDGSDTENKDA